MLPQDTRNSLGKDGEPTSQARASEKQTCKGAYLGLLIGGDEEKPALSLEMQERKVIEEAISPTLGNLAKAVRLPGLTRVQLAYRLQKAVPSES